MNKFKVGDKVRVIQRLTISDEPAVGNEYTIIECQPRLNTSTYRLGNCPTPFLFLESQLKLTEPKEEKKVAKTAKIENGTIYEMKTRKHLEDFVKRAKEQGRKMRMGESPEWMLYEHFINLVRTDKHDGTLSVSITSDADEYRNAYPDHAFKVWEITPEPTYPIIERFYSIKVVFNPPYTIVEFDFGGSKTIGKAKCNPSDTYDKWEGYKLAYKRMLEASWTNTK